MAVRVPLRLSGPAGREVVTTAVLNGGFEIPEPHLLLPQGCAEELLGDYAAGAHQQAMDAAGGEAVFLAVDDKVNARVVTDDHEGTGVAFSVLVSEQDTEVLVSDAGIDRLGLRIESFSPGRWRFAEQTTIRDSSAPRYWSTD